MAVNRLTPVLVPSGGFQEWAYIGSAPAGASMWDFVAQGNEETNTIAGARYRVLQYYTAGQFSLNLDRPGKVDVLVVGGGGTGAGFNQDNQGGQYTGGGGAGGYRAEFGHILVSASASITVGNPGQNASISWASGSASSFNSFVANGGGHGGGNNNGTGASGGSGGGGTGAGQGGSGVVGTGNNGAYSGNGGGGGGAGGAANGNLGGPGLYRNWDGTWRWYSPGGNSSGNTNQSGGQTPYQTSGDISKPGAGGGGNYYPGSTTDVASYNGTRGIVIVRFRVA